MQNGARPARAAISGKSRKIRNDQNIPLDIDQMASYFENRCMINDESSVVVSENGDLYFTPMDTDRNLFGNYFKQREMKEWLYSHEKRVLEKKKMNEKNDLEKPKTKRSASCSSKKRLDELEEKGRNILDYYHPEKPIKFGECEKFLKEFETILKKHYPDFLFDWPLIGRLLDPYLPKEITWVSRYLINKTFGFRNNGKPLTFEQVKKIILSEEKTLLGSYKKKKILKESKK